MASPSSSSGATDRATKSGGRCRAMAKTQNEALERRRSMRSIERLERQVRLTRPDSPTSSPRTPPSPRHHFGGTPYMSRQRDRRGMDPDVGGKSPRRPRPPQRQQFADDPPARSFDDNGYCSMHPDVRMAKRKSRGGWIIQLELCPKCASRTVLTKRQPSGDTESTTTSEDDVSRDHDRDPSGRQQHHSRRDAASGSRNRARDQSRGGIRRPDPARGGGGGRSRTCGGSRPHPRRRPHHSRSPPRRGDGDGGGRGRRRGDPSLARGEPTTARRRSLSNISRSSRRSLSNLSRSSRRSRSRGGDRSRLDPVHSIQPPRKHRTVCVDGAPFDKSGRCFVHPHVKLASKKILGGWKIHMEFCPLCLRDSGEGDRRGGGDSSVISGMSRLTDNSGYSSRGDSTYRSSRRRSQSIGDRSHASAGSRKSIASSFRSSIGGSVRSVSSWSTGRSSKGRVRKGDRAKDDSFLPLDQEGYCLHHPDVQLAKMSRKGGLRILMDFCPECASDSLAVGGGGRSSSPDGPPRHKTSLTSANSSCNRSVKSGRSAKSDGSHSTFIESMPYIDGDGKPGHYTGHVDAGGQPNGRGKMRYINGSKFDGVWHEGTKLHGKITSKKKRDKKEHSGSNGSNHNSNDSHNGSNRSNKQRQPSRRQLLKRETPPTPPPPPPPPPPMLPQKKLPGSSRPPAPPYPSDVRRSRGTVEQVVGTVQQGGRRQRDDAMPSGRGRQLHEGGGEGNEEARLPRRSLSRLRRKCDEIESLLRAYPTTSSANSDTRIDI